MPEMTEDKGTPEAAVVAELASSGSQPQPTGEELQAQLEEAQGTIRKLRRFEKKYKALTAEPEPGEAEPQGEATPDTTGMARLKDKLAEAQRRMETLERERRDALLRATVVAEASKLGFEYPEDVWDIMDKAELDPDDPEEIADLVRDVAKTRPRWLRGAGVGVGAGAGGRRETDDEKRARLFGASSSAFWKGGGVIMSDKE